MGNPQKIKFRNLVDFLDSLPDNELKIVEFLRELILDIPYCKEKLSYNVPFYYRHSRICFIWPASVPWGAVEKGVAIGFCRGTELMEVNKTDNKAVTKLVFTELKQINVLRLRQLMYEAILLDEKIHKAKSK